MRRIFSESECSKPFRTGPGIFTQLTAPRSSKGHSKTNYDIRRQSQNARFGISMHFKLWTSAATESTQEGKPGITTLFQGIPCGQRIPGWRHQGQKDEYWRPFWSPPLPDTSRYQSRNRTCAAPSENASNAHPFQGSAADRSSRHDHSMKCEKGKLNKTIFRSMMNWSDAHKMK